MKNAESVGLKNFWTVLKKNMRHNELGLLHLWREASKHFHLEESVEELAEVLRGLIAFDTMQIRMIEPKSHQLFTVAQSPASADISDQKRTLSDSELDQLSKWCRSRRILSKGKRMTGVLGLLISDIPDGDVLAIPLHEEMSDAALILFRTSDDAFDESTIDLAHRICEPFAVAVANHHRVQELASLREAAEADKGALLRRLGRTDLGDQIIGETTGLRQVMERVHLVATSNAPVMILGETGSGKEMIARALHSRGSRPQGPFIRVNCGAIPPELIDSQLFGHEKGAFTGADQTRQGWFERADGGTLFLDEIGELPLEAQVRFLRVLQDGFVERVGSNKPIHVDVRVVAATHRDLASMVSTGKFREDLWYRLAVFPILLPPLRERRSDIAELAYHFAERAATRFGLNPVRPTDQQIKWLENYDWPGNIRELGTVMDRAAILGNGKRLDVSAALGLGAVPSTAERPNSFRTVADNFELDASSTRSTLDPSDDLSLDSVIRRHIEDVLKLTRGKVEGANGAAELLKINPHTLRARMRKLKIAWAKFRG